MSKRYYSLATNGTVADIDIYGDITSWPWLESDVSAYNLSQQLAQLSGVDTINVNINSYGGEVSEGLAIFNALKRHSAKVVTRCDGFACSIAATIFMAGDERIMHDASLLMVHNAWIYASGNATDLRKQADDLEQITAASKAAFMSCVSISEEELTALMDAESWIAPSDALDMGFATAIESFDAKAPSQNARQAVFAQLAMQSAQPEPEPAPITEPEPEEALPEETAGIEEAKQRNDAVLAFFATITK